MGGALEYSVGSLSGAFAGFSGESRVEENAPRGTSLPEVAPPARNNAIVPNPIPELGFRPNDAETNLLEHLFDRIRNQYPLDESNSNPVSGRVRLFSEHQPCTSCDPTIRTFMAMYPNVQVDVYYVLPYPPIRRDRPTL